MKYQKVTNFTKPNPKSKPKLFKPGDKVRLNQRVYNHIPIGTEFIVDYELDASWIKVKNQELLYHPYELDKVE